MKSEKIYWFEDSELKFRSEKAKEIADYFVNRALAEGSYNYYNIREFSTAIYGTLVFISFGRCEGEIDVRYRYEECGGLLKEEDDKVLMQSIPMQDIMDALVYVNDFIQAIKKY